MFQALIYFLSAILSGIIKVSIPIAAVLAGLITAVVTVWLEKRKDQKEKLQDRKDAWLGDHWKYLAIYLYDISEFGLLADEPRDEVNAPTLGVERFNPSYQNLGTALSGYNVNEKGFAPYCNIDAFKDNHSVSLSHVGSGYKELKALLDDILSDEKVYFSKMSEILNNIGMDIKEMMQAEFPALTITNGLFQKNCYRIYDISNELIKCLEGNLVKLSELINDNGDYCLQVEREGQEPSTIIITQQGILQIFKNNIWSKLKGKYKNSIKELQNDQEKLKAKEKCWTQKIKEIINFHSIGFSIGGKCKICEKMINEKNINNIRPPEIKK